MASVFVLGACGGGGGGSAGGHDGAPTTGVYSSLEYDRNYGLRAVHAADAYASGITGAGVLVGVVDTGVDVGNPEFAGAIHPASRYIVTGSAADLQDPYGHGTAVAGVIRAARNGAGTQGLAYDSTLLVVRADAPGSCATTCSFTQNDLASATSFAAAKGARVINYSLGGSAPSLAFSSALTQAAGGAVLVAAAGNLAGPTPIDPALSLALAHRGIAVGAVDVNNVIAPYSNRAGSARDFYLVAPGTSIAAPALGGGVATWSGTSFAAPHVSAAAAMLIQAFPYLTPAQVIDLLLNTATDLGDAGTDTVYGRGLVNVQAAFAPQGVLTIPNGTIIGAGGADVIATAARLGPAFGDALAAVPQLRRVAALDDYGRPYVVDLSGRIDRATATPDIAGWLQAGRTSTALARPFMGGGGVALQFQEQRSASAPEDGLTETKTSPFSMGVILPTGQGFGLSRGYGMDAALGFADDRPANAGGFLAGGGLASPFLGIAGGGDSVAFGTGVGPVSVRFSTGAHNTSDQDELDPASVRVNVGEVGYRAPMGVTLTAQFGTVREHGSLLQSTGGGAYGFGEETSTQFIGWFGTVPLSQTMELAGSYSMGMTDPSNVLNGLFRDFSVIRTDAFGMGIFDRGLLRADDRIGLILAQPLRVARGSARIDVPTGRAADGTITRASDRVDLSPSGREIDTEIQYQLVFDSADSLMLNMMLQLEPGHVKDARPNLVWGLRYKLSL